MRSYRKTFACKISRRGDDDSATHRRARVKFTHAIRSRLSQNAKRKLLLLPRARTAVIIFYLLAKLGDALAQPRHFTAGIVLVNDTALRCTRDHRLCVLEGSQCRVAVAAGYCFLDLADRIAQQRPPRLVDLGTERDLARGFAGGRRIGHSLSLSYGMAAISSAAKLAGLIGCPTRPVNAWQPSGS